VFADRYVGIHYGVYIPALDDIIYCPVIRGPITEYAHDGYTLNLEISGKESRGLDPFFVTHQYQLKRGMTLEEAVRHVVRRLGERRIHLPALDDRKLHRTHGVAATAEPWAVIAGGKHVSGLSTITKTHHKGKQHKHERQVDHNVPALMRMDRHHRRLMYDSRGRLTTRHREQNVHWHFRDGTTAKGHRRGPTVLSRPSVQYDEQETKNHVVVRGHSHKGRRVEAEASLPHDHPLSPQSLAKNGEPLYMTEFVTADDLRTHDECKRRAEKELKRLKDVGVNVAFDALPLPFFDEGDHVSVDVQGFRYDFYMNQWTLPLRAGSMSVGYTKHTSRFADRAKHPNHHDSGGRAGPGGPGGRGGSR
jgi:hypothetical protein